MFELMRPSISNLRREMDRLFEDFASTSDWPASRRQSGSDGSRWGAPALDLLEKEDEYVVRLDLPGVEKDDIDIQIANGVLTVSGERQAETEEEGTSYYHFERRYGTFSRSISLPSQVSPDAIEATFDHGVLTVNLPKTEESRPRRIAVQEA